MTDTTRTHRCIDCPLQVEHTPDEICPSCGRCSTHCHGRQLQLIKDTTSEHAPMKRVGEA